MSFFANVVTMPPNPKKVEETTAAMEEMYLRLMKMKEEEDSVRTNIPIGQFITKKLALEIATTICNHAIFTESNLTLDAHKLQENMKLALMISHYPKFSFIINRFKLYEPPVF